MIRIGILSLQGDIAEQKRMMEKSMKKAGMEGVALGVKCKDDLRGIDALVIPGGESTTIGKLIHMSGLDAEIKRLAQNGTPILGTCAGLVLLSKKGCEEVEKTGQQLLGLIDIDVERNAFGRQRESFETELEVPAIGKEKYPAVFIRAPGIVSVGKGVEVLSRYEGRIVAARKDNIVVLAFHPELSSDTRMHEYFLKLIRPKK